MKKTAPKNEKDNCTMNLDHGMDLSNIWFLHLLAKTPVSLYILTPSAQNLFTANPKRRVPKDFVNCLPEEDLRIETATCPNNHSRKKFW